MKYNQFDEEERELVLLNTTILRFAVLKPYRGPESGLENMTQPYCCKSSHCHSGSYCRHATVLRNNL